MSVPSLESKKAYFAKVRRANYAASLRLEGFTVKDGDVRFTSRKAAVLAHSRPVKAKA
ncbi:MULTISPECIES: YhfG family protein [unclassified Alcanivorax]|uniref:YhfG family protein n=1 Tax=unclassified Alcanivorax TaxID=2638842 RepID=UPI000A5B5772|nr:MULTISPECIES: YhfG family protein [unclassified Alcanivorax]